MDSDTLLLHQIALSKARGISGATVRGLLERIGDVSQFFSLSCPELHRLTGLSSGIYTDDYRKSLLEEAQRDLEFVRSKHISCTFIDSDGYPSRLRQCEDAPVMLYQYGSCNLDRAHMVAVVGTRNATAYGVDFTMRMIDELAKKLDDLVIVSGLAYGIDAAAHRASITAGVPTVGVLAHDLNHLYPAQHRQMAIKMASSGGALLTEYPLGTEIHRNNFLARNRIVAGLTDCTVVVESDYKGGSLATARIAMQYGREVMAVPGRVNDRYSRGTNRLIANQTASLLENADQLIEYMGWSVRDTSAEAEQPSLFRPLSEAEQQVLDYIDAHPEATVNELCVRLGCSYATISDMMMQLEMDDIVITLPGGRFARTALGK